MNNNRQLSGWQVGVLIVAIFCGTFGGMAWMTDQLILDCEEQSAAVPEVTHE